MLRIQAKNIERWLNATKNLENDLSENEYSKYASITSNLDAAELYNAYSNALCVVEGLINELTGEYQFDIDLDFTHKLYSHLDNLFSI